MIFFKLQHQMIEIDKLKSLQLQQLQGLAKGDEPQNALHKGQIS